MPEHTCRRPSAWFLVVLLLTTAATPAWARPAAARPEGLSLLEALRLALDNDPNIARVELRREGARGSLLGASSAFDSVLTGSSDWAETKSPIDEQSASEEESFSLAAGWSQRFRQGFSVSPNLDLSRLAGGDGQPDVNVGTLSVTLRQPLLEGRGRSVVAAQEDAARLELEAVADDIRQTIAERLLAVAQQYWRTEAAARNLDIFRASSADSQELLDKTRRLVAADLTPEADLILLQADLNSKESRRIAGEGSLFAALQALGREIGLEFDAIADLELPSNRLPREAEGADSPNLARPLFELALAQRRDLEAARLRLEASRRLLEQARNGLLPQLDLVLTPTYTGLVEGGSVEDLLSSATRNSPGLSSSIGLSLRLPVRNLAAEGALLQAQTALDNAELTLTVLDKRLGAEVPAALDAVRNNALQLDKALLSVQLFERALENEGRKLDVGASTLIDVISQQDRLTAAQQNLISARLALALALLRLRFETGTLLSPDDDLSYEDLVSVPSPGRFAGGTTAP